VCRWDVDNVCCYQVLSKVQWVFENVGIEQRTGMEKWESRPTQEGYSLVR